VAQKGDTSVFQLVDGSDKRPIVFATVILLNSRVGVISDENGNFRIPVKYLTQDESLRISCIGYETQIFEVGELQHRKSNVLTLIQKLESLDEIVLKIDKKEKQYGARKIVRFAIKNIPNNYPVAPFGHIAYYRDYQKIVDVRQLEDKHPLKTASYVNLNEGIVKVFDAGFGTNKFFDSRNQAALIQYGLNRNFATDSLLAVPYDNFNVKYLKGVTLSPLGGNELYLLSIGNCIRNYDQNSFSFVGVMNKDFVKQHSFWIDKIVFLDDEPIYKIDFLSSIQGMDRYFKGSGSIYVGKYDYGIHRLNYTTKDVRSKSILYEVNVEYKKRNGKYYLNYLTFNNFFDVKHKDVFKVEDIVYHFDSNSFQVFFNRKIDPNTIDNTGRTIAFYYKNKKLDIKEISYINPMALKIKLYPFTENIDRKTVQSDIVYGIQKVRDIKGNVINEGPILTLKQFREIFVQEVMEHLEMDTTFNFIQKNKVLSASEVNTEKEFEKYWVNSPLMESK
jgi:hypothetical protein